MQNFMKTIINAVQNWTKKEIKKTEYRIVESTADWNQNDPGADNYVKNRTHWEEKVVLVDNLTYKDYNNRNYPKCTFIIGKKYDVIWNGTLYKDLICHYENEWRVIASDENGCPFYIDDNGGDDLYIEGDNWTVSIYEAQLVVHKLDPKYLPELIATPDWNQNNPEGTDYIKNRPFYEAVEYITYIPEQTVVFSTNGSSCYINIPNVDMPWDWVPYRVTFDGVEYEGTMTDNADNAWIDITLDDDVYMNISSYGSIWINSTSFAGEHTIKVEQKAIIVHTIDTKYLGVPIYSGEGEQSICINSINNVASGYNSYAEGSSTTASGQESHAEGGWTAASGYRSHAEGYNTIASGYNSHAEGGSTIASGYSSHAEGGSTIASGDYSHAEGLNTIANFKNQHVIGKFNVGNRDAYLEKTEKTTTSSKIYATTFYFSKTYTIDQNNGLFVLDEPITAVNLNSLNNNGLSKESWYLIGNGTSGKTMYSLSKTGGLATTIGSNYASVKTSARHTLLKCPEQFGEYVSIVGNGTSDTDRSNAHTLDWNGVGWYQGGLQVGGNAQDDGAKNVLLEGDAVPMPNTAKVGQLLVVKAVDENGKPTEWESDYTNYIILKDEINGFEYFVKMQNGNLVSSCKLANIQVTTAPTKINYIDGEPFDKTDMIVTATYHDGTTKIIDNYTYDEFVLNGKDFTISYEEYGIVYTTTVSNFTVTSFDPAIHLIDFDYTTNTDGTYTITGWKQTLNGEPSTEMIIPNNCHIIL